MDGPVEDATWPQHAPSEEEGAGQPVVMHILQENQDHGVPAGFNDLMKCMMGFKPAHRVTNITRRKNQT